MTTVDVPTAEFVVNQTTFYLALLITLGSAGAIIAQVVRGINNRIKKTREEAEERGRAADEAIRKLVDQKMKEVDDVKTRVDFIYWRIIERFFDQQQREELHNKNGTTSTTKKD